MSVLTRVLRSRIVRTAGQSVAARRHVLAAAEATISGCRGEIRCLSTGGEKHVVEWYDVPGHVPYKEAWEAQQKAVAARLEDRSLPDVVLCLEHEPVYTLGRGAKTANLRFDYDPSFDDETHRQNCGADVFKVERGGEVTWHGPGQLVVYPILDLARTTPNDEGEELLVYEKSLRTYVTNIEEVVIRSVGSFGMEASRVEGLRGVWVGMEKVGAVGIAVTSWITYHGLSLNVCPNMEFFQRIIPCGIEDRGVCSLASLTGQDMKDEASLQLTRSELAKHFADVFNVTVVRKRGIPRAFKERVSAG